jgi:hypothetical protein
MTVALFFGGTILCLFMNWLTSMAVQGVISLFDKVK